MKTSFPRLFLKANYRGRFGIGVLCVYMNMKMYITCVWFIIWYPREFSRFTIYTSSAVTLSLYSLILSGESSAYFLRLTPFTILHFSIQQVPIPYTSTHAWECVSNTEQWLAFTWRGGNCQHSSMCYHIVWCKLHKKQHMRAFFGKSVLKCHLT